MWHIPEPETGSTYCSGCHGGSSHPIPFRVFSHHHVAPATGETRDAVVRLDALAALAAAAVAVALHPMVQQICAALGLLRLDVGVDARGRRVLHATLVYRVLANWKRMKEENVERA